MDFATFLVFLRRWFAWRFSVYGLSIHTDSEMQALFLLDVSAAAQQVAVEIQVASLHFPAERQRRWGSAGRQFVPNRLRPPAKHHERSLLRLKLLKKTCSSNDLFKLQFNPRLENRLQRKLILDGVQKLIMKIGHSCPVTAIADFRLLGMRFVLGFSFFSLLFDRGKRQFDLLPILNKNK